MELSSLLFQAQSLNDKSHQSLEKTRLRALDSRVDNHLFLDRDLRRAPAYLRAPNIFAAGSAIASHGSEEGPKYSFNRHEESG